MHKLRVVTLCLFYLFEDNRLKIVSIHGPRLLRLQYAFYFAVSSAADLIQPFSVIASSCACRLSLKLEPPSPAPSSSSSKESVTETVTSVASLNLSPAKGLSSGSLRLQATAAGAAKFVPTHRKCRSLGTK